MNKGDVGTGPDDDPSVSTDTRYTSGDEELQVHDQLPSVEEVRGNSSAGMSSRVRLCYPLLCCFFFLVIILGVGVGVGVGLKKKNGSSESVNSSRSSTVKQWLFDQGLSSDAIMLDVGSPQYRAAEWISDQDELRMAIPEGSKSKFGFIERYALATFFLSTTGDEWTFNLGFLSGNPTCSWNRKIVSPGADPFDIDVFHVGATCNEAGQVTSLSLPGNGLIGVIPEEIGHLSSLSVLGLELNTLIEHLPNSIAKLTRLEYFTIQYNLMSGGIPSYLGEMTSLRVMGLGNNFFQGKVPSSLTMLTNLVTLGLDDNLLSGDMTFLQGLTNMERLYLENNLFVQTLDSIAFGDMMNLEELDLSTNGINGTIPIDLLSHGSLQILDLRNNGLTGTLPSDIPLNENLTFFSVAVNTLNGTIPSTISSIIHVSHLDFSQNLFTGTIPTDLGSLTSLMYLFLATNPFKEGTIPSWIHRLDRLKDLSLRNTSRLGGILNMSTLENLVFLDLSSNNLNSTIPDDLGNLTDLSYLFLNRNFFQGYVPSSIRKLSNLDMLLLDKNSDLSGSLEFLCLNTSRSLQYLIADCTISCSCCTLCCSDSKPDCNDDIIYGSLDPIWEHSFERRFYQFSKDIIFRNLTGS